MVKFNKILLNCTKKLHILHLQNWITCYVLFEKPKMFSCSRTINHIIGK